MSHDTFAVKWPIYTDPNFMKPVSIKTCQAQKSIPTQKVHIVAIGTTLDFCLANKFVNGFSIKEIYEIEPNGKALIYLRQMAAHK